MRCMVVLCPVEQSYLSVLVACVTIAYMGQETGKKESRYEAEIQVSPQLCAEVFLIISLES